MKPEDNEFLPKDMWLSDDELYESIQSMTEVVVAAANAGYPYDKRDLIIFTLYQKLLHIDRMSNAACVRLDDEVDHIRNFLNM